MKKNKISYRSTWSVAIFVVSVVAILDAILYNMFESFSADIYRFYEQTFCQVHWLLSLIFVFIYIAIYVRAKQKATEYQKYYGMLPLHVAIVMSISISVAVIFVFDTAKKVGVFEYISPKLPHLEYFIADGIAIMLLLSIPVALLFHHISKKRTVLGITIRREI